MQETHIFIAILRVSLANPLVTIKICGFWIYLYIRLVIADYNISG
jgi:hypothetical protein